MTTNFQAGRFERPRKRGLAYLGTPLYLSPLARITTPGHLRVKTSFAARLERPRKRGLASLGKPLYLSPLARLTTPGHLRVKTTFAITRFEGLRRRKVNSTLHAPTQLGGVTPVTGRMTLQAARGADGPAFDSYFTRTLRDRLSMAG